MRGTSNVVIERESADMALSKYEKETIIIYNEAEDTACVYTCNEKLRNKLEAFSKSSTECVLEKQDRISAEYKLPKAWVRINKSRQYSDEAKQAMSERAKINLSRKGGKKKIEETD